MALLAVALLLILAAPAHAGTAAIGEATDCEYRGGCSTYSTATFAAAPGEANDVTVTASGNDLTISDAGAPVTAGAGCRAVDAHSVACSGRHGPPVLTLTLGDRDDRAVASRESRIEGGDGNDHLTGGRLLGGEGDDTLDGDDYNEGGPGNDRLTNGGDAGPGDDVVDVTAASNWITRLGPGSDVFIGGPGDDHVEDGEDAHPSRDRIDGGGGLDTIDYRTSPVGIAGDLGQASQFPAHDDVSGFERVAGSRFGDQLLGSDGPDYLDGRAGDDVFEGRGGDDRFSGDEGADRFDGGPGDDFAFGGPGADRIVLGEGNDTDLSRADYHRDEVDCGPGIDKAELDRGDRSAGCEIQELFRTPRYVWGIEPARGGRWRVQYFSCETWPSCRGGTRLRAIVRGRSVRLPTVRFEGNRYASSVRSKPFRLPRAAARELRRKGVLSLRLTTTIDPGVQAGVLPSEQRMRLRRSARKAAPDR